jgi:hypothetical protein
VGLPQQPLRLSFPSYERIAERAGCARSTVAEAIKALEWCGALSWQHRITRIRERCRDLFGRDGWRWRVIRTSNAYIFRDPQAVGGDVAAGEARKRHRTREWPAELCRDGQSRASTLPYRLLTNDKGGGLPRRPVKL